VNAVTEALRDSLVFPDDLLIRGLTWTSDLSSSESAAAKDRHFFAIADRFGGSHELMNELSNSVELEYYFRKSNGAMRRGFAMGIVGDDCSVTMTYIGVNPYRL
jgi:hypothetical protein